MCVCVCVCVCVCHVALLYLFEGFALCAQRSGDETRVGVERHLDVGELLAAGQRDEVLDIGILAAEQSERLNNYRIRTHKPPELVTQYSRDSEPKFPQKETSA